VLAGRRGLFIVDLSTSSYASSKPAATTKRWGDRPVLLLLDIRLGLDGLNPVYYETIKVGVPSSLFHSTHSCFADALHLPAASRAGARVRLTTSSVCRATGYFTWLSEPPASRAGSQEPRAGSLQLRTGPLEPRAASPPVTDAELVLNA
jgi:hypothetical protein